MSVKKDLFGKLSNGTEVEIYTLTNINGMTVKVTPYGCRLITLETADKNGDFADVILGHRTLQEYTGVNFQGSFVGRYANRIGGAEFAIDGETYKLSKNDGDNSLHGGSYGFHQIVFAVEEISDGDEPAITFTHLSPNLDEGYPGNLKVTVKYTISKSDELIMDYSGVSDMKTVFNPTNHSFFNLSGNPQKNVFDTELTINAGKITDVSDELIPTGEYIGIKDTSLDFTMPKKLGKDMFAKDFLIDLCGGFDHNYCAEGTGSRKIAEAYDSESGRLMEVFTDLPGVQLYTFNSVSGLVGKDGFEMKPHTAFCLETQFYPDSPNHPNFPFSYLMPNQVFNSKTIYKFSVK